jgi:monoamine oxidase
VSPLHAPAVWPARGRVALAGSDIGGDEAGWFEAAVTSGRAAAAALA